MDKAPASLIDAQPSSLYPGDGSTAGINQYVTRPGQPYLSPARILSAIIGPFGIPYKVAGLAMQTCTNMYITAPEPYMASAITHQAQQPISAGQYGIGAAPTSGIYTGVEDQC